ncbi:endochitinase A1-like [Humulus lupulus]|uniref:endochitinase A1-like n=1 Tax=Humulus lupulus TaxID=3486 RepID=UPI002B4098E5|nr:endochitinase A1-like [Humulus lupulus]
MKTRGCVSSSKSVKPQQETLPESVPTATLSVPASIPAISPTPGRRSKTTARKKVLALSGPISSSVLGASSKGVTFTNLDAEPIPASAVSLASPKGQIKAKPALATSQSKSTSTEDVSVSSDHDSESSLSPDVLTPKAKGKRKSKAVGSKKGKRAKVEKSKGTSSIYDSSPLSRFKLKANINPPPCTSSEDLSPETEDSQPELDPSLTEPNPEVPLDDLAEETDSEEDPSEASPVASNPKGTTPLAFPELSSKLAKQKGAPIRTSEDQVLSELVIYKLLDSQRPLKKSHETLTSPLVGPTYTVKDDHPPSTTWKVKGINLAGPASRNVVTEALAVPTDFAAV